jgi:hypothetical protein
LGAAAVASDECECECDELDESSDCDEEDEDDDELALIMSGWLSGVVAVRAGDTTADLLLLLGAVAATSASDQIFGFGCC